MTFNGLIKQVEKSVADNSPAILIAVGAAGVLGVGYLASRASFRIGVEIGHKHQGKIPPGRDLVRSYWKKYIPATTIGAITIGAIVGSNRISTRRAAAMSVAMGLTEQAFREYKDKVVEKIGERKEEGVRDAVAQDKVARTPVTSSEIIITGNGQVLCFDTFTGRYFEGSHEGLKKAQNDLNYKILHDNYASLGDFYELIGLPGTDFSEEVGWNTDHQLELEFSSTLTDDRRPCLTVTFNITPIRNYFRFGGSS